MHRTQSISSQEAETAVDRPMNPKAGGGAREPSPHDHPGPIGRRGNVQVQLAGGFEAFLEPRFPDLARSAGVCVSGGARGIVFGGKLVGVPANLSSESHPAKEPTKPTTNRENDRLFNFCINNSASVRLCAGAKVVSSPPAWDSVGLHLPIRTGATAAILDVVLILVAYAGRKPGAPQFARPPPAASEGVGTNHLADRPAPRAPPRRQVDRVLDEADRAIGESDIDAAGVVARGRGRAS